MRPSLSKKRLHSGWPSCGFPSELHVQLHAASCTESATAVSSSTAVMRRGYLPVCVVCPRSRPTQRNTAYLIAIMFIRRVTLRCGASLPWRIVPIDLSQSARTEQLSVWPGITRASPSRQHQYHSCCRCSRPLRPCVLCYHCHHRPQPHTHPDTQRLVLALRRSRHTRQLCSCCGRCRQLLPDLAAATGSFPIRRHTVGRSGGRGAGFLFPEGRSVGHLPRHATVRACPCVLVCVSGEMEVPVL